MATGSASRVLVGVVVDSDEAEDVLRSLLRRHDRGAADSKTDPLVGAVTAAGLGVRAESVVPWARWPRALRALLALSVTMSALAVAALFFVVVRERRPELSATHPSPALGAVSIRPETLPSPLVPASASSPAPSASTFLLNPASSASASASSVAVSPPLPSLVTAVPRSPAVPRSVPRLPPASAEPAPPRSVTMPAPTMAVAGDYMREL
jgi:hypothetical protein